MAHEVDSDKEERFSGPITRTRSVATRAVIAEQRDTQLEASAFAWRAGWPGWLTTALELNYLAVTTRDVRPALVIHWSILEILADQLGPATTVLALLDRAARDELIATVRNAAEPFLNATSVERVLARISDTQVEGTVSRIHAVLRRYSVEPQATDINEVRKQRGKIAHGVGTGNAYELAERQARTWVQAALRTALTSGGQAPSGRQ